ncbi:hypothetical protein P4H27_00220 [Paenibacillus taichungensis]|uniref:hypothetical protein n=1 Tax=Paenibacillus taichungensis TaxID=484184 RepID=UPI002DB85FE6|nr:hypothetical protein [Paenibacillus taichungensis]MEC0105356.1 hypothetical protein [Paenibacillus taichungensis]MEC0200431.1 hypothetical protein [Paenibacillus taichungensis]
MYLDQLQVFIQNGKYLELKQLEKKLNALRNCIMNYQKSSGQERMVWRKLGVVGIFTKVNIYEDDRNGLYDHLNNFGLLPHVVNIHWDKLSTDEQEGLESLTIQRGNYLRYWPNKSQTVSFDEQASEETILNKQEITEILNEWRIIKWKHDRLEKQWSLVKKEAVREWGSRDRKIKFSFGTLSLIKLYPQIPTNVILDQLDMSSLIRSGSVNYEKVYEFAAKGYFNKSDIDKFRNIKDVSLRYALMEMFQEAKRYEYYKRKLNYLSEWSRQR